MNRTEKTINGVTLVLVERSEGGLITQKGQPGIVYRRDDGNVYLGIYRRGELISETRIPELDGMGVQSIVRLFYCAQNEGDCSTCSLVNYGRDCQNHPVASRG